MAPREPGSRYSERECGVTSSATIDAPSVDAVALRATLRAAPRALSALAAPRAAADASANASSAVSASAAKDAAAAAIKSHPPRPHRTLLPVEASTSGHRGCVKSADATVSIRASVTQQGGGEPLSMHLRGKSQI